MKVHKLTIFLLICTCISSYVTHFGVALLSLGTDTIDSLVLACPCSEESLPGLQVCVGVKFFILYGFLVPFYLCE